MRKLCINLNGTIAQDVSPELFSFSDEDFGAFDVYNKIKVCDHLNVVTLVHRENAIGYCSYVFGSFHFEQGEILVTLNVDSVFIKEEYRKKGYSSLLATYVAYDLTSYIRSMIGEKTPYTFKDVSNYISDDGFEFTDRACQMVRGERPYSI